MKPAVFTQGQGRLTADILNNYQNVSREVEQLAGPFQKPMWQGPYLMRIKSSTALQNTEDPPVDIPNRWLYDLEGIEIDDIRDPASWSLDSIATEGDYAINMVEAPNTDTVAMGVTLSSLPTGFELQPIADDTLVWAYFTTEVGEPGFQCLFSSTNQFDGTC